MHFIFPVMMVGATIIHGALYYQTDNPFFLVLATLSAIIAGWANYEIWRH